MHDIHMAEPTQDFARCWQAAGLHIQTQGQNAINSWLRAHLAPPILEHLSFRLGNQLFFVRIEDQDAELRVPGSLEGLFAIAEGCNGYTCLMPMRRVGQEWRAVLPGWGLKDARSGHLLDPVALVSDELIEMTDWELQDFAVQVVRQSLEAEGRQIMSWQNNPGVDPSLWFVGGQGPEWVVVRAVKYPEANASLPDNLGRVAESCARLSRKGNFASVAFANADDPFDPLAKSNGNFLPLYRGHGCHVRFEGLTSL